MTRDHQLEERLWDYVYDLLSDDEKQALTARITSEPEVARAYAEISLQADVIAEAVRVKSPAGRWSRATSETGDERPEPAVPGSVSRTSSGGRTRLWGNWLAAAAAVLLIAMMSSARWTPRHDLAVDWDAGRNFPPAAGTATVADPRVRTTVYGPRSMVEGAENWVTVQTRDLKNLPVPTDVELQIQDPQKQTVWTETGQTDANGVWQVSIPAPLAQNNYALLANTVQAPAANSAVMPLQVAPPQFVTHVSTDRIVYAAGEPMFVRSVTLSRPSVQDAGEIELEYRVVREEDDVVLEDSVKLERTVRGVGTSKYQLDADLPEGEYTVVATSRLGQFREAKQRFYVEEPAEARWDVELEFLSDAYTAGERVAVDVAAVQRDGKPLAGARFGYRAGVAEQLVAEGSVEASPDGTQRVEFFLPDDLPAGPGYLEVRVEHDNNWERKFAAIPLQRREVQLQLFPEGGQLAAELPNRVYFEAQGATGKPVAIRGKLVDSSGNEVVAVATEPGETTGRGQFTLVPAPGESYRVVLDSPSGAATDAALTAASATEFAATLQSGDGVFAAGEPLAFDVHASREGRPLVVAVACGGIEVGQLGFDSRRGAPARISVPVTEDAEGVLRVTLFDFAVSPARAIAERLVFRQPAKALQMELEESPVVEGRRAKLALRVMDEQAKPVDAIVGAVVRQTDRFVGDEDMSSLVADYLLLSEIDEPAAWEDARIYLSDSPTATRSLDLLLATRGWRRLEELTPNQLALRFRRSNVKDSFSTKAGFGDELSVLNDEEAIVQPPTVADNLAQVLETPPTPPPAPLPTTPATVPAPPPPAQPSIGRVLLLTSALVVLVMFTLAIFRLASAWIWMPTAGLAMVATVVAVQWIGGLDQLGRPSPSVGAVARTDEQAPEAMAPDSAPAMKGESMVEFAPNGRAFEAPEDAAPPLASDAAAAGAAGPAGGGMSGGLAGGGGLGGESAIPGGFGGMGLGPSRGAERPGGAAFGAGGAANPRSMPPAADAGSRSAAPAPLSAPAPADVPAPTPAPAGLPPGPESLPLATDPSSVASKSAEARDQFYYLNERLGREGQLDQVARQLNKRYLSMSQDLVESAPMEAEQLAMQAAESAADKRQVRMYSEAYSYTRQAGARETPATLYWHPLLVPDTSGQVVVEFDMPASSEADSKSWEFQAVAHGSARLGEVRAKLDPQPQLDSSAKLPKQAVEGDRFVAQLELANNDLQVKKSTLKYAAPRVDVEPKEYGEVDMPARSKQVLDLFVTANQAGPSLFGWSVDSGAEQAAGTNTLTIVPRGYPAVEPLVGAVPPAAKSFTPSNWRSQRELAQYWSRLSLRAYPSLAAEVEDAARHIAAAERMSLWTELAAQKIRHWLDEQRVARPTLQRALKQRAATGQMPTTTSSSEPWETAWYQAEAGVAGPDDPSSRQWPAADAEPYLNGLAARVALLEESPQAPELVARLAAQQQPDGHLPCQRTFVAIDNSTSLEATAYAALAWSHPSVAAQYEPQRTRALNWLRQQRRADGGFGSTDATALVALALLGDSSRPILAPEDVALTVRGMAGAEETVLSIAAGSAQPLVWHRDLASGEPMAPWSVSSTATFALPFVAGVEATLPEPPVTGEVPLTIATRLAADSMRLGETTLLHVRVEGRTKDTVAISLGLPAGLTPDIRNLPPSCEIVDQRLLIRVSSPFAEPKEWVRSDEVLEFDVPLVASFAGTFTSPPARVHPEHTPSLSGWAPPLNIVVQE